MKNKHIKVKTELIHHCKIIFDDQKLFYLQGKAQGNKFKK